MIELLRQLIVSLTALVAMILPATFGAVRPAIDDGAIETITLRMDAIDFTGTHFRASRGAGIVTEDQITATNGLRGKSYTDNEYAQIKEEIVSASRSGTIEAGEELAMWIEFLNTACAGKTLNGMPTQEEMNILIETDCK